MAAMYLLELAALLASTASGGRLATATVAPPPPVGCAPVAGDTMRVAQCSPAQAEAQEFVAPVSGAAAGPIHMKVTYVEGLCLDAGDATAAMGSDGGPALALANCQPARKAQQSWQLGKS